MPLISEKAIPSPIAAGGLHVESVQWLSSASLNDSAWDEFLQSTSLGQFQQTSLWSQVKTTEGWHVLRETMLIGREIVGGFQILYRPSRFGKVGYLSKGPVLLNEDPMLTQAALDRLLRMVRDHQLSALIVQPPDSSTGVSAGLHQRHFAPNHLIGVIEATALVDLGQGINEVDQRMSGGMRRDIRMASRRGITIRVGDESDLDTFFNLMLGSCRRQGVRPNPPDVSSLRTLWNAFHPTNSIRLSFAEYAGETLGGMLCIAFGNRVTLWKKGWQSGHADRHPNELLNHDALKWACSRGYASFDFVAIDRAIATTLLEGLPLSELQMKSRHFFHLRFGAQPKLLPGACVYFAHPFARFLYSNAVRLGIVRSLLPSLIRRLGSSF